jgi:sugar phosphate isomerase/epimerase
MSGDDPDAKPILEAASRLGIRYVRVGNHSYSETGDIQKELGTFTQEIVRLTKYVEAYGMTGGYHNHSGDNQVGAALWDLHRMVQTVNRPSFGSNFDTGHATVEGGLGVWRINARLLAPHVKMMSVKDFVWEDKRVKWVPLGQGQVQTAEFLKLFRETGFAGPISMHFEYDVPSNDTMLEEIRAAAVTLRGELRKAGYA